MVHIPLSPGTEQNRILPMQSAVNVPRQSDLLRPPGLQIPSTVYMPFASFATKLNGINLIADIGNGTMNVLYMINGKPQSGKMFTEKFGTYQCILAVREA